jgi:hypothetical protein
MGECFLLPHQSALDGLRKKLEAKQGDLESTDPLYQEREAWQALTHSLTILKAVTHQTRRLNLPDYDVKVKEAVLPEPSEEARAWAKEIFPLKADTTPDEEVLSSDIFLRNVMRRVFGA